MNEITIDYLINSETLNGFRWPTEFAYPPRTGDIVRSSCGRNAGIINHIVHCNDRTEILLGSLSPNEEYDLRCYK